eukprot:6730330-Prymnesium_polylepis.1
MLTFATYHLMLRARDSYDTSVGPGATIKKHKLGCFPEKLRKTSTSPLSLHENGFITVTRSPQRSGVTRHTDPRPNATLATVKAIEEASPCGPIQI